ncbi:MAG: hypothetical protein ACJAWV_002167 [Flammeovirgaceae bacterium]|jgi:hypothetical protein
MKISNRQKIAIVISFFVCGYGCYLGISSRDYDWMLYHHDRLELRSHYLQMCNFSKGNVLKGKVIKVNEIKGGAKTVYIKLSEESDSIFLSDYNPEKDAERFSIQSGVMKYWLGWVNDDRNCVVVGSTVYKESESDMIEFRHSKRNANVFFFHWYKNDFSDCEDAQKMDILNEYKLYLHHAELSDRTEGFSPSIQKQLDSLILEVK